MKKDVMKLLSFVVTMLFIIYRHDIVGAIENSTGSGTKKAIKYEIGKQFLKNHDLNSQVVEVMADIIINVLTNLEVAPDTNKGNKNVTF